MAARGASAHARGLHPAEDLGAELAREQEVALEVREAPPAGAAAEGGDPDLGLLLAAAKGPEPRDVLVNVTALGVLFEFLHERAHPVRDLRVSLPV
ncbi:MAG: hypothetical protein KatS3mg013_1230 [Actinomycetota bacterium]|nr:MAG: hypothetical protein KatS3mg013_1230 [Actinomycetota bacterium]